MIVSFFFSLNSFKVLKNFLFLRDQAPLWVRRGWDSGSLTMPCDKNPLCWLRRVTDKVFFWMFVISIKDRDLIYCIIVKFVDALGKPFSKKPQRNNLSHCGRNGDWSRLPFAAGNRLSAIFKINRFCRRAISPPCGFKKIPRQAYEGCFSGAVRPHYADVISCLYLKEDVRHISMPLYWNEPLRRKYGYW